MSSEQEKPDSKNAEPAMEQATLLFVDDEKNILSSLRRLFRSSGYKVLIAEGGAQGLALLEQEPVDLVISDMRMPEMDGAEFLEKVAIKWPDTVRILLTGYADMQSTVDAINKGNIYKYISKPWEDNELKLSVKYALEQKQLREERDRLLLITEKQNEELKDLNANLENKVVARTAELDQTLGMYEAAHDKLSKSYLKSVEIFSNIIEMREGANMGLSRHLADRVLKIAEAIGMNGDDARQLTYAALLHDIGKISLPDRLVNKPYNSLGPEERAVVERHPIIGAGLLMSVDQLHDAAKLIQCQHERYDGKGYPAQLKGDDIPLGASILSLLNDFDALQTGKLTSQKFTHDEAVGFIKESAGTRYRKDIVDIFMRMEGELGTQPPDVSGTKLVSDSLEEGMVLTKDLLADDGVLLLSKGYLLDAHLIEKIRKLEQSLNKSLEIHVRKTGG